MQQTRGTKQTLLRCRASISRAEADILAEKLPKKDSRQFWKEIDRLRGNTSITMASTIGSVTRTQDIANYWREHYMGLLSALSTDEKADEIKHILSTCSALEETIGCDDVKEL